MATAEEKEAKQAVRDIARAEITAGRQRLESTVARAGQAFPQRRLRSAGDLSRYAIGGFLSDALPPVAPVAPKPKAAPKAKARAAAKPKAAAKAAPKPVVRATKGRGVLTSTRVGGEEARYINRGVGIRPTGPSRY